MNEFFQIALSMPTVVFSALLVVLSLYWGLVILGAVDLDFVDFDLDIDVDLDLDVEVEVGGEAPAEVEPGGDASGAARPSALAAFAGMLGLGTVPVTVVISISTLFAWLISFTAVFYLRPIFGDGMLGALLIGLSSAALSLLPTMLLSKPLKHLFETREGPPGGRALIGSVCVVATSRVDESFGRGTLADDGAGLILPIRCDDASNRLTHGSQAIIIDFDGAQNIYMVEAYDVFLGTDASDKAFDLARSISRSFEDAEACGAENSVEQVPHTES